MKFDWQWPAAAVFCTTFLCMTYLISKGILHIEVLIAALTWLAPGPWKAKDAIAGSSFTTSVTKTEAVTVPPTLPGHNE